MSELFGLLNKGNKALNKGKEQLAQVTGAITEGKEQGTNLLHNAQSGLNIATTVVPGQTQTPAVVPVVPGQTQTPIVPVIPAVVPGQTQTPVVPGQTQTPVVPGQTQTPVVPGQTQTSEAPVKQEETWFAKLKPLLTIETTIASLLIVSLGVALYFVFTKFVFKEGFFGSDDPVDTKEQNSKQVKVDEVERQLQDRITKINTNLTALKKRMDDADIVKNNKPTNLAIAIQNNILAVKEAMMKIIAGLVVQTKMNNGALNVVSQTNAFQQDINDSLKKFK
jgi:hypothetical protein